MPSSAVSYDLGERIILEISFTDSDDDHALFDPDEIFVTVCDPLDNLTHYEYGVNDELTRASEGEYELELSLDVVGSWQYRWHSHGTGQAAKQRNLIVNPSRTPDEV